MPVPAYVKHLLLSLLFVVAAVNFTRTTLNVIDSSKRLDQLRGEVLSLADEKKRLEADLLYKRSDEFVEMEARNKLGMAKPGEELFVVGDILDPRTAKSAGLSRPSKLQMWVQVFSRGFDNI